MIALTADVNYFVRANAHTRPTKSCLHKTKYIETHDIDGSSFFFSTRIFYISYTLHVYFCTFKCNVNFQSVTVKLNFTP